MGFHTHGNLLYITDYMATGHTRFHTHGNLLYITDYMVTGHMGFHTHGNLLCVTDYLATGHMGFHTYGNMLYITDYMATGHMGFRTSIRDGDSGVTLGIWLPSIQIPIRRDHKVHRVRICRSCSCLW